LSGRRLRHSKAEERLKEWAIKQAEKEKAKAAELAAKKADKMLHKQQVVHAFAEESQKLSERTATALQRGLEAKKKVALQEAREEAKRELVSKHLHNPWDLEQEEDVGDDDNEEDQVAEEEDFVIQDEGRVTCDVCEIVIVGQRFHSVTRDDYDQCAECHAKEPGNPGEFILVIQSLGREIQKTDAEEPFVKKRKEEKI
jgi:hypothetical protein